MTGPLPDYYQAAAVPGQVRTGLCELCRTPIGDPYRFCFKCHSHFSARPDVAGFACYAIGGDQSGTDMRRYKASPPSVQALGGVQLLLEHCVNHLDCAGRLAGAGLDAVAVVPSRTHYVPGAPSPLQLLCTRILPRYLRRIDLRPAPGSISDRQARTGAFTVPDCRDLSHVLVVDDTWVSGATMLSAVATIRARGARLTSSLALARWLNPQYPPTHELIVNVQRAGGWKKPEQVCPFTLDGTCPS